MMREPTIRRAAALLGTALLLGIASCTALDPDPRATIGSPGEEDLNALSGEALYARECASCHGASGIPVDTSVKTLRGYAKPFESFDSTMTEGPSGMPQFPEIDAAARHRLYDYIKTFPQE
jgi:mono/diheme cytochrome c family protein